MLCLHFTLGLTSYDSRHAVTYNVTSSFPKPVADVMKRYRDPELAVDKYNFFTIATAIWCFENDTEEIIPATVHHVGTPRTLAAGEHTPTLQLAASLQVLRCQPRCYVACLWHISQTKWHLFMLCLFLTNSYIRDTWRPTFRGKIVLLFCRSIATYSVFSIYVVIQYVTTLYK